MRILIVTPVVDGVQTGNRSSAEQWMRVIAGLGHQVEIAPSYGGESVDLLVGLHALKSAGAVAEFKERHPAGAVVLVMTGTDIYPEPSARALGMMGRADGLVALQPQAAESLPVDLRDKVSVIVQAAVAGGTPPAQKSTDPFDVCVVGHLRDVKDPLRAAAASRLLPPTSKIRLRHAGAILQPKYHDLVEREQDENPRYEWLGQLDRAGVSELIASSQLLVVSSLSEGAGRVVGKAVVEHTPVLSTRIDGVVGLLGEDYPGLYAVGDTAALAALLTRAETEASFREELASACVARESQFDPSHEIAAWRKLLEKFSNR